ncbi:MAG: threonine synthase, partial [Propionibacteriaceae bacterium]|nr:threonine synthase [Propionibacteriaceae bacterium]
MRYTSTRSDTRAEFSDILLEGLAPDGGLYLPQAYPDITGKLPGWRRVLAEDGYAALAEEVLRIFAPDIAAADLAGICQRAYN